MELLLNTKMAETKAVDLSTDVEVMDERNRNNVITSDCRVDDR